MPVWRRAPGEHGLDASMVKTLQRTERISIVLTYLRKLNITHMDEILGDFQDTSHLNILPFEPFGLLLIVKIDTFAGLFVRDKCVSPVSCLDYFTDENL